MTPTAVRKRAEAIRYERDLRAIVGAVQEAREVAGCEETCKTGISDDHDKSRWEIHHECGGYTDTYSVLKRNVPLLLPGEIAYWLDQRHEAQKVARWANTKRRARLVR